MTGDIDLQTIFFQFIGGLGIFLLGIKFLGEGLQKSTGNQLREILDKYTSNPFLGILAGILVTVLMQSNAGTVILTVALVNAGYLTLRQSIGLIMGANIGTTFTAIIIGFNIGQYSLPIIALGAFLLVFFKQQRVNVIGQAIFGFGSLFFGLRLMSMSMAPLGSFSFYQELTTSISENPLLGIIIGAIFTMIVQSSTATIGVLQNLYAEHAMDLATAIPILLGDNIGTIVGVTLAAIGVSIAAKRAAFIHLLFNVIGAMIYIIFLPMFLTNIAILESILQLKPKMTIAFAHGTYNVFNTLIHLPFIPLLIWLAHKVIPGDAHAAAQANHLDPIFIQRSSTVALSQAKAEVVRMGELSVQGLEETRSFVLTKNIRYADAARKIEEKLNRLDKAISDYLMGLSGVNLSEVEITQHTALMDAVRDIERIGDHFENIVELVEFKISNNIKLSEYAHENLQEMFDMTILTVKEAMNSLQNVDREKALIVLNQEEQIDKMERKFRKNHIIRMNEGICSGSAGIVFIDIISNLERIGDHAVNIAEEILHQQR